MNISGYVKTKIQIESEIEALEKELQNKKKKLEELKNQQEHSGHSLSNSDIRRYSRQIIVPTIGVQGQEKLKKSSVVIVGCGGLGCPAAQYLAGCGVGRIGLIDYDEVEESNLHRQVFFMESSLGIPKVSALGQSLKSLNSSTTVKEHHIQLSSSNALDIMKQYDVVLDASDNVSTRYLVNDACVLTNRPLVSGSAVRTEGQLSVYNYQGGPCYRCLFPEPPPPETVSNCGDVGVLGPVPGAIGVLQALQAIHIIVGSGQVLSGRLLLFDGADFTFKTVRVRNKVDSCAVCGSSPSISELIDYEQFCGAPANDKDAYLKILSQNERLTPQELYQKLKSGLPMCVIDVRQPIEFAMCRIPGSINIPLQTINKYSSGDHFKQLVLTGRTDAEVVPVCLVCRRGNDSQLGVDALKKLMLDTPLYDLMGGLHAWARDVDSSFAIY